MFFSKMNLFDILSIRKLGHIGATATRTLHSFWLQT